MHFYSNENFDLQVVMYLRELGHDVLTAFEAGNANQRIPDDQVLSFALMEKCVLLTFNRKDFFKLHKSGMKVVLFELVMTNLVFVTNVVIQSY